jgi:hypothetical protein
MQSVIYSLWRHRLDAAMFSMLLVERERRLKLEADQEVGLCLWLARQGETPKKLSTLRAKTRLPKFNDLE